MRYLPPALVVLLFVTRSVEMAVRHGAVRGRITHPGTWWALFLGGSLTVAAALAEYFLQPHPVNRLLVCTGVAIGIASFALRGWAAAHLRAYWSMHIEVRDDHPLVTDGPYGWVRHPIYTAAALELVGAIVTLQSWWSLIVLAVAFIPAVTLRIRLEERAMTDHFGEPYRHYMATTPALVRVLPPGRGRAP